MREIEMRAACAVIGALAGGGCVAVVGKLRNGSWFWQKPHEAEAEYEVAEETVGDSELAHKPDIFSMDVEDDDKVTLHIGDVTGTIDASMITAGTIDAEVFADDAVRIARTLSYEEWMDLPQGKQNVATWFAEDEILAGENELLEELDPETVHGGIGTDALDALKSGSGVYVLCGDGETGLEIVVSHGNYLEEYECAHQAVLDEAAQISIDEGYSRETDEAQPARKPVRRRR